ncbi:hypothetical protein [Paraburkholderia sp.]|jgi:hypothetical protein|uniref:hypothetical protein n=1 Tax=Paraburkholderia sp. TaxID=1926495 RepID=UPI002F40F18F
MRLILSLLAIIAIFPATASAYALDDQLSCTGTAHDFVNSLVNERSIETPAMHVEANSVNAFRPAHDAVLTAFGLRVRAVFGYEPDDPLFKTGGSKSPSGPTYGVVVFGSADAVKRRLAEAGSAAIVHPVIPLVLTAVVCRG